MHAPKTTTLKTPAWQARVAELLDDPVARAVLRRDGLTEEDVFRVMAAAASRLGRAGARCPQPAC